MAFGIDDIILSQAISWGIRGLSSLFGDDSDRDRALAKIRSQIGELKGFSLADKNKIMQKFESAAKSYTTQALNNTALGTARRQGAEAAVVSSIAPSLAFQKANVNERLETYNKNLDFRKVALESGLLNFEDTDTGQRDALSTVGLGLEFLKTITEAEHSNDFGLFDQVSSLFSETPSNPPPPNTLAVQSSYEPDLSFLEADANNIFPSYNDASVKVEGIFPIR